MSSDSTAPVPCDIDFNAHHAPPGAFGSFTLGKFGRRGGFGLEIGTPGDCDVYIGHKAGTRTSDGVPRVLPFYEGALGASGEDGEAARYDVEKDEKASAPQHLPHPEAIAKDAITRTLGIETDRWEAGPLSFELRTPLPELADPAEEMGFLIDDLRPVVPASLRLDNTDGDEVKTLFFAINFNQPGSYILDAAADDRAGFAWKDRFAVIGVVRDLLAGEGDDGVLAPPTPFMRFSLTEGLRTDPPHQLGNVAGLLVEVQPGQHLALDLNLIMHRAGTVTTGLEGSYLYTRQHPDLHTIASAHFTYFDADSDEDAALAASGLSPEQQFLVAQATKSYFGSTMMLDVGGEPFWIVNEGEYCMMNTLDLSVDHVFFELRHNPWVVRNLLGNFVRHYSYVEDIQAERCQVEPTVPGGISFCHDMGVHNCFSPRTHSSYELSGLTGCFSYMTAEELCNWVLMAGCYVAKTDDRDWLKQNEHVLQACLTSMTNRGGEHGLTAYDSARCDGGAEITTYDSLDHSLAQTRNNLYIATKCWATYRLLAMMLPESGAMAQAEKVAAFLAGQTPNDDGTLPAVFEEDSPGHASRILPAVEGLVYPHYCGLELATCEAEEKMIAALKRHTLACIGDDEKRNHFPDGGIRLSSTSENSWMSKIFLFQHVCRKVLDIADEYAAAYPDADKAHVHWLTRPESGYQAFSDQIVSGIAKGSLYYPRGVTNVLWLED